MVQIGANLADIIKAELRKDNTFIISDENVGKLYKDYIFTAPHFLISAGEESKSIETYMEIVAAMIENGCNRYTKIVALGGGVVGDLAGFVAATFMRGVEWTSIPTTLLSQVDSGIGGKTGINFEGFKNLLGVFHQPSSVLISHHFLDTLPPRERLCGIGEIIKTAFLSAPLKTLVTDSLGKLLAFDKGTMSQAIKLCVQFKEDIVKRDEKETLGIRKCLNLGHTIGHAIEKEDNYTLSHGEYVLWGLWFEAFLTKKYIPLDQYLYMSSTLRKVLKGKHIEFDSMMVSRAAMLDKKNDSGRISIIAAIDINTQREMFFSQNEIYEGIELCKKTCYL